LTIVGKVENSRGFFAAGGQTIGFSQLNADSICLPMFPLVKSLKELSTQQSLGENFRDCQLEPWLLGALQVVC